MAYGIDPIAHRQLARDALVKAASASKTFAECAHEYHKAHADNWKNVKHGDQWVNTLTSYAFPKFGSTAVGDVSNAHILAALAAIWKTKAETASRVLQRMTSDLRKIGSLAVDLAGTHNYHPDSPQDERS